MMREVKYLSRLNHSHIVRYYTSWLEQELISAHLPVTPLADDSYTTDHSYSTTNLHLPAIAYPRYA